MEQQLTVEVIIIGGSYAGLSAALALGRALRRVLVLDSGQPCNRPTPHAHNFLTRDGTAPAELAAQARAQALAYPTVQLLPETAVAARGSDGDFTLTTDTGRVVRAGKLLFATGVRDQLPARPGFAECWGISVIHCPYCHGYEYHHQPTGTLLNGEAALEHARLLRQWTDQLTIFTDGPATFSPGQWAQLADAGIEVEETPVRELRHQAGQLTHIGLLDGRQVPLAALYLRPGMEQHCLLPRDLGCAYTEAGYLQVDGMQKTSVPGIYAAGDATMPMRALSMAVAGGTMAGAALNSELLLSW
ncbi:NAD(P)/FAD-dependent oxidoreductase [Hymenobacter guriensis]|uniref:NAD(P)/FAD-dependent oxidoreductase n=1 Tax=Hymenobacter guriensis TaxID=2793065 RepID=A0ABS0L1W4_9BACT|nr:NAD(P)/FAD-dependent oxidoreductase [Hymenobacter guriensis]MBG8554109.1 NAD(P)/FAD-dependent oxidoreductase [Hymenobacter guriensis]